MFFVFLVHISFSKKSISITPENVNIITNKSNDIPAFVEFWNPYCTHCQHFKPTWSKFSEEYDGSFLIADVDCIAHEKICERFKIDAFPTLKWIHPSRDIEISYTYDHDLEGLRSFAKAQLLTNFISIDEKTEISKQKSITNFYLFKYKNKNSEAYRNVQEVSNDFKLVNIPVFTIQSSTDSLTFNEYNSVYEFKEQFTRNNLRKFFYNNIFSYFNELKPEFIPKFHKIKTPIILYFLFDRKDTKSLLRANLNQLKSKYQFFYTYFNQKDSSIRDLFKPFSTEETFLALIDPKTKKYKTSKALLTEESLLSWIKSETEGNNDKNGWQKMYPSRFTVDNNDNDLSVIGVIAKEEEDHQNRIKIFYVFLYFTALVVVFATFKLVCYNQCKGERSPGQPIVDV